MFDVRFLFPPSTLNPQPSTNLDPKEPDCLHRRPWISLLQGEVSSAGRGTRTDSAKNRRGSFPICGNFRQMPSWVDLRQCLGFAHSNRRYWLSGLQNARKNLYPPQKPSGNSTIPHGSWEKQEDFSHDPSWIRSRVVLLLGKALLDRVNIRTAFAKIPPAFQRNPSYFSEKPSWTK
jgi:hypothetical protein